MITTNCVILGRADGFAAKHDPVHDAAFGGLMMSLGFGLVLVLLGALRELLGSGTLFANMHLLFWPHGQRLDIQPAQQLSRLPAGYPAAGRLHRHGFADCPEKPRSDEILGRRAELQGRCAKPSVGACVTGVISEQPVHSCCRTTQAA